MPPLLARARVRARGLHALAPRSPPLRDSQKQAPKRPACALGFAKLPTFVAQDASAVTAHRRLCSTPAESVISVPERDKHVLLLGMGASSAHVITSTLWDIDLAALSVGGQEWLRPNSVVVRVFEILWERPFA